MSEKVTFFITNSKIVNFLLSSNNSPVGVTVKRYISIKSLLNSLDQHSVKIIIINVNTD